MNHDGDITTIAGALEHYLAGQINRRTLGRLLGAMGAAGVAAVAVGSNDLAKSASLQDGTPPADEPLPPATPVLGERPDGSRVWRVQAGAFDEVEMVEAMGFFPGEITINAGDSIYFDFRGFHTATFLSGAEPPYLIVAEERGGTPTPGDPRLVVNPMAGFPVGGTTYDGTGYVNSGTPDPSAPPFTLTFTAPGTYDYLCLVHPQMQAKVVVQESGTDLRMDQAAYDQLANEQAEALLEEGRTLISQQEEGTPTAEAGGAVHEVSVGLGGEHVEVLQFFPRDVEIAVGDTVRWTNPSMHEPHTVTFLGADPAPEFILVEPQEGGPPVLVFNPLAISPVGGDDYDGAGLINSGALGEELAEFYDEFPRTATYELTFTVPGEYGYYCVFHSGGPDDEHGMTGSIIVT